MRPCRVGLMRMQGGLLISGLVLSRRVFLSPGMAVFFICILAVSRNAVGLIMSGFFWSVATSATVGRARHYPIPSNGCSMSRRWQPETRLCCLDRFGGVYFTLMMMVWRRRWAAWTVRLSPVANLPGSMNTQ
ncbi:hypothetical protein BDV12DRAFT_152535 [Aspergillus spectabilis]